MLIAYDSLKKKTFISGKKYILVFFIQSPRCNLSAPYKTKWLFEVTYFWKINIFQK